MLIKKDDEFWMREALNEAQRALDHDDVPIGAIAVLDGEIIARGHNRREIDGDPIGHAEMFVIRDAANLIGHWRLEDVTLYCTLEPCVMCAGAMILARLPRLVYATHDPKAGAAGSIMDILNHDRLNHRVAFTSGILADEAASSIRGCFVKLRVQGDK